MEIKVEDYQKMMYLCYDTENKEFYYIVDDDWEIIPDSKLNDLIIEYFNENPEFERAYRANEENNGMPF